MVGVGGESLRGAGGRGEQPEEQQRADRLGCFGGGGAEQREEQQPERADGDAAGGGDARVDAGEQQRPGDRQHDGDDPGGDQRGDHGVGRR